MKTAKKNMLGIEIDPISTSKVFLGHRCANHRESTYIYEFLKKHINIWYSCDGAMGIGEAVIPRMELITSDFIIFLASAESLSDTSISAKEFSISQILEIRSDKGIGMVALNGFKVPPEYSDKRFETFSWNTRNIDASRLLDAIKRRIRKDLNLVSKKDPHLGEIWLGGKNTEPIVEYITTAQKNVSTLKLSAPIQHHEMTRLVQRLNSLKPKDKGKAIEFLVDIYHDYSRASAIARQNAIYIVGQLLKNKRHMLSTLRSRYPDFSNPFLFRGFHIALSYIHNDGLLDSYMDSLEQDNSPDWNAQRDINTHFHLLYYESLPGVLDELRRSIKEGRPLNLLRLNVFTLGEFSNTKTDIKLLEDSRAYLKSCNVPNDSINQAIKKIKGRLP